MDEGGLAWDDTNNNRAFLSGTISATNNGASIYIEAKKKPDYYQTEKGKQMKDDILHADIPGGAGGQFNLPGPFTDMLMGYSKNQKPAKDFLRWMSLQAGLRQVVHLAAGLYRRGHQGVGRPRGVERSIRCSRPFKKIPATGRLAGYAGPPNQKAAEVIPSTSSSTCTPRRSRACRRKTPSNGRTANW